MRDIKFRCFNTQSNSMLVGHSLSISANGSIFFLESIGEWTEVVNKEWIIVMQFTGLRDKNGKEIYEGDKVKRRVWLVAGSDYMDYTCEVKWNGWCNALFIADKQVWALDPIVAKEIEVTGNIYEHTPKPKAVS